MAISDYFLPRREKEKNVDDVVVILTNIVNDLVEISDKKSDQMKNYMSDIDLLKKKHDDAEKERTRAISISQKINSLVN